MFELQCICFEAHRNAAELNRTRNKHAERRLQFVDLKFLEFLWTMM